MLKFVAQSGVEEDANSADPRWPPVSGEKMRVGCLQDTTEGRRLMERMAIARDAGSDRECGGRRAALAALLGGAMVASLAKPAGAQLVTSPDTVPLQFALNIYYITCNYVRIGALGLKEQLDAPRIRGGETLTQPGVPITDGRQIEFSEAAMTMQRRVSEMAYEFRWRTIMLRDILRADAVAQKKIDLSAGPFTAMFRQAGAIGPNDSFDPWASMTNYLVALETLLTVQATVLAGMLPTLTNDSVMAQIVSLSAGSANSATTARCMVRQLAADRPELLTMIDRLAAWRDGIDGSTATDSGLSPVVAADGRTTSRMMTADGNGLFRVRTPQQALNVLFMSRGAVSQGGFLPTGINGGIVTSAAN